MPDPLKIIVLEGDETGQELLVQACRVLDPEVLSLPQLELESFDLSLDKRRRTGNEIVHEAARAMREAGFGIKAATVTPEGKDDVGSPNRILREEVGGKVIVRTGRRIPGVVGPVSGVYHPISVVRMAIEDAYGAKQWREGAEGAPDEVAYRTEKVTRSTCRAVAEYAFQTAERMAAPSGRSRPSTRACSRRRWTPRPRATRTSTTCRCSSTRPTPAC
jgi:isocitrate dehydrogenase (NAD+)